MRLSLHLLSVVLLLCTFAAHAQSPPGINYQGVARNLDGKPLALKDITIKINILRDGENGPVEYSETHTLKTNSFGLFTLVIGTGSVVTGDFLYISWAMGNKWLRVEMDPDGGSRFQIMGSMQFMSVPYAFYAKYSGNNTLVPGQGISIANNVISNTGDADNSPTNETNTSFILGPDFKLRLVDSGGSKEVDLSALAMQQALEGVLTLGNDAGGRTITNLAEPTAAGDAATKEYVDSKVTGDPSSTNEIQDLSLTGNSLRITNNTSATPVNLGPYLDNTDSQNLTSSALGTNRTINISGGSSTTIDVADNDNNSTNEIQNLAIAGDILSLSNDPTPIDLTAYRDNTDNQDLQLNANTLSLTGDATPINLAPYLDDTDDQTLSLSGTTLLLTTGGSVNLAPFMDNTDSQDLTLNSNILSLSGDPSPVNLTPYLDNTDNQNLSVAVSGTNRTVNITGGTGATFSISDGDSDATNEIQTLAFNPTTRNLSITMGSPVNIPETQNIAQVLTQSNDAGGQRITNLGAPAVPSDAVTKQYVDNADIAINARISANYAFKTGFAYSNLLTLGSDIPIPLSGESFDDFGVVGASNFIAATAGTYIFIIDGSITGANVSLLYNGTKYPVTVGGGRTNTTYMFRLTAGQTVSLVLDGLGIATTISGSFFGYKLL